MRHHTCACAACTQKPSMDTWDETLQLSKLDINGEMWIQEICVSQSIAVFRVWGSHPGNYEECQLRGCTIACFLLGLLFGPEVEAVCSSWTLFHFYWITHVTFHKLGLCSAVSWAYWGQLIHEGSVLGYCSIRCSFFTDSVTFIKLISPHMNTVEKCQCKLNWCS